MYFVGWGGSVGTVVLYTGYNRVHNSEISGDERRVRFGASLRLERERIVHLSEGRHLEGESGDVNRERRETFRLKAGRNVG